MTSEINLRPNASNYNSLKVGVVVAAGVCSVTLIAFTALSFLKVGPFNPAIGNGCGIAAGVGTLLTGGLGIYTYSSWQTPRLPRAPQYSQNPKAIRALEELTHIEQELSPEVRERLKKPIQALRIQLSKAPRYNKNHLFSTDRAGEHHAFHSNLAKCLKEDSFKNKSHAFLEQLSFQRVETPDGRTVPLAPNIKINHPGLYERDFKVEVIKKEDIDLVLIEEIDRIWNASFAGEDEIIEPPKTAGDIILRKYKDLRTHLIVAKDQNSSALLGFMFIHEYIGQKPNKTKFNVYCLARSPEAACQMRELDGKVKGVAEKIFDKFNEMAGAASCKLRVRNSNVEAIKLYEHQGFHFIREDAEDVRDFPENDRVQVRKRAARV